MVNRPKVAGTRFETAVVNYLRLHGFPYCERRALRGRFDAGDVLGVVGWTIETKATREISLGQALTEAKVEASNGAGTPYYAVVHKRRNHSVEESFVTMPLWAFAQLLADEEGLAGAIARHPANGPDA